ncbi:ribonuclease H-like domain-containing protein [Tanacetum coccineum]
MKMRRVCTQRTSLVPNTRRNNEKALNILLSAIPDRHLLSFHDAVDARSLWKAIKARFGGNEASKKMQKNLLKQQFETFTIGSREELDSAYERFQHILSMLELHDATVSIEDANLKFLRSLPSVWHVVATMIRGQPGLDELEFDDLYNNLKVYELELKGVSNSNSQNIAFLSTEVKGSTLKQMTYAMMALTGVEKMIGRMEYGCKNMYLTVPNVGLGRASRIVWKSDISSGDETLTDSAYENFKREKAYKAVPPPTGTIIPPRANVSFTGIDELAIRNKETAFNSENSETSFENRSPNSQNSVGQESRTKGLGNKGGTIKKKDLKAYAIIDSGCSGTQCSLQVKNVLSISMFKFVDEICKFCWVFFLAYKDETYDMLHDLIVGLENRLRHKVKTIRCDNGTEFKNQLMNEFCAKKGIKREYSIARDSQQMVLQKTSIGLSLIILGKFDGKSEEGYLLGYSTSSKGFRVYNRVTRTVQECLHVNFLENQENQKGKGPDWMTMASEERTDAKKFHCPLKNKSYMAELLNLTTKISIPACLLVSLSSRRTQESLQALADERWLNRSRRKLYNSKPARAQLPEIEAIRLFLAFAIFLGLHFYQMDVKSAFLYGNITEDSVCQTASRFEDPDQYKQVKQSNGGIFLSQDKYVKDILNKFDFRTIKPASTPIEAHKSLGKDEEGEDVDVHLYRSMIGCLMYLTASRPDIMFVVCLCARFQVTPRFLIYMLSKGSLVTMLGTTMIEDQLQEDVNILEEDWSLGNARNKQLWAILYSKQNM